MANTRNRPSPDPEPVLAAVAAALSRHLPPSSAGKPRLVLGLSGGVDSIVLLHALTRLRETFQLSALHVHHGLSPHADAWADFCAKLCRAWHLPLEVVRVRVEPAGQGVEAAARKARYQAFGRLAADWVLLAHHRGDQAETLLLNLLRGAGVAGAAAMPECRMLARHSSSARLLRPLLALPRRQILEYARRHRLAWVEDESNASTAYGRNFLRLDILPALHGRFPGAEASLARAAEHFADGMELLADLAEMDLAAARNGDGLRLSSLAGLSPARRRNLLRHWLRENGLPMPDAARLEEALRQTLAATADADPVVQLEAGRSLRRYQGNLYLVRPMPGPTAAIWQGEPTVPWSAGQVRFTRVLGQGIQEDRLAEGSCRLETRQGGEAFCLHARRPLRPLKKLLQEAQLPPWQRLWLPCLWCGEHLVWVHGLGVAAGWQCGENDPGWLPTWQPL